MPKIVVSGLVNTETTARVHGFPIEYFPIDYPFFGVNTAVSGVGCNLGKALRTLGDEVSLLSMTGDDVTGRLIAQELRDVGISDGDLQPCLSQTPNSVVLYDSTGRRQIYCDLKDIQETEYPFDEDMIADADIVVACNINFNRPLLHMAKQMGKTIATDVHVLFDVWDAYNREFMEAADILFLSDEGVGRDYEPFLRALARTYENRIIVLGRGAKGAAMYVRETDQIVELPAAHVGAVVNTVGAGDALFSSFLHYYAKGMDPVACLKRAQVFAAAKITVSGAAKGFITEEEVENLLTCL